MNASLCATGAKILCLQHGVSQLMTSALTFVQGHRKLGKLKDE